jgi:hypothetical protein
LLPTSVYIRRFFTLLIVDYVIISVPFAAAVALAFLLPELSTIFLLVAFCASAFLFVRLVMVFPSVAIGDFQAGLREQFSASWRQMDGQFWLFIGGAICVAWPFILLTFLLMLIGLLATASGYAGWLDLRYPLLLYKLLDKGLISFAISVLDVGLASWLYAWVRQEPSPPSSSDASA